MSLFKLLLQILGLSDGAVSASELTQLGNIVARLADNTLQSQDQKALQKEVLDWGKKHVDNIKIKTPQFKTSGLRAGQARLQSEAEKAMKAELNRQMRELEALKFEELKATLAADREMLNMLKGVFYTLETNLYERLAVYTPVDTGNLISSLYAKHVGLLAVQIGFNTTQAPYAMYVHERNTHHPNGGISQFLLQGFVEAWMQTMASAVEYSQINVDQDFFYAVLRSMNYGIDIAKNKLAVTVSLGSSPLTNLNSILENSLDAIQSDAAKVKGEFETQFSEYRKALYNYLNDSNISLERLEKMSRKGRKKWNLFELNREYTSDHKSTKSWRQRQDRLAKTAKSLHKFDVEDREDIYKIRSSAEDKKLIPSLYQSGTGMTLSTRLAVEGSIDKRIIYPLILDKVTTDLKRQQKEAERALEDEDEITDDDLYISDDFDGLLDENAVLAADEPPETETDFSDLVI